MLKKCIFLLLFLSSLGLRAQEIPDSTASFKKMADWVLAPLIQNNVPSGILLDRVYSATDLVKAGTDTLTDSTSGGQFIQILYDLEEASLEPSPEKPHQHLMAEAAYQNQEGIIPLGMIRMVVQGLDTSLIDDSSLVTTANRQLKIRDGLSVNPFITRQLQFASALVVKDLEMGRAYTIEYPRLYTNLNAGAQISYARIRIDGGPELTLNPGETMTHTFQVPGNHSIDLEIGWADGVVARSTTPVSVMASCSDPDPSDELSCWKTEYPASCGNASEAISADIEFQGKKGKAEVYYYRRNGVSDCNFTQNPLRNPIIFVDGIDFGDTRKGQAIYGKYLRYQEKNPNGSITTHHLGNQLRSQNRDILILNFPNGIGITKYVRRFNPGTERWEWIPTVLHPNQAVTEGKANPGIDGGCDFIERNAMILVKLIQMTKSRMADPNEKIILVGPSMGGLISRYALAYMEKNQATTGSHNCKIFISQDSPQLGANIPIGIQALLKNLGEGFGVASASDFLQQKLNQPAAQEMLLNHVEGFAFGPHPKRSAFLQNQNSNSLPNSLGWPTDPNLRKIAIINGSLNGKAAFSDPDANERVVAGDRMFDFNARLSTAASILFRIYGGPVFSGIARRISIHWETFFAPSSNQVRPILTRKWQVNTLLGHVSVSELQQKVQAFNSGVSIDAAPGGYYDAPDQVYQKASEPFEFLKVRVLNQSIGTHKKTANFIPTKSALAFHWNTDQLAGDLGENLSNRNLVCTGEIPFDDYFQPPAQKDDNTKHVLLTKEGADYILNLLNPSPPQPLNFTYTVDGPRGVQSGSRTAFTTLYQGNYEFFTRWSILQTQGVSVSLSNAEEARCFVQVGNGAGNSTDGFFVLRSQMMVKLPTGEVICAGNEVRKVFVRKIFNTGHIEQGCDLAKENYSLNFRSMRPETTQLSNGPIYHRNEWQISRYDDESTFGQNAYQLGVNQWAFSLSAPYFIQGGVFWYSKQEMFYNGGLGIGASGTIYIRTRPIYKMANPDNPGEIIEIPGAWKKLPASYTVTTQDPICLFRPAVGPDPAVKDVDETVRITDEFGEGITFPIEGVVLDGRGEVVEKIEATEEPILVSIKSLEAAGYTLRFTDGNGNLYEKPLTILLNGSSKLSVSPNPAIKELDAFVQLKIVDPTNNDHEFEVEVRDFEGQLQLSFNTFEREFELPVQDLAVGNYIVTVKGNNSFYQEEVALGLKGTSYLVLTPNPVSDVLHGEIVNPVNETGPFSMVITDKLGNVVIEETVESYKFDLDVHHLAPDLYYMKLSDGNQILGKIFRKL